MIRILKNEEIDREKWDNTVLKGDYSRIYGLSWYLDIVCPQWQGLVADDYTWIFPLPVKYKLHIPYLVQPVFCQQLGIYGVGVKSDIAGSFFSKIHYRYPYINICINHFKGLEKRKYLRGRINYELDLTDGFENLQKDYSENTIRNIRKAEKLSISISSCTLDSYLDFIKKYGEGISDEQFEILSKLLKAGMERQVLNLFAAKGNDQEYLSVAAYFMWNWRIIYLAGASSPEGKKQSAMFLIFDKLIRKYAASGWILDFEGSMISGVARFFRGFGARSTYYYTLKKYFFWYW